MHSTAVLPKPSFGFELFATLKTGVLNFVMDRLNVLLQSSLMVEPFTTLTTRVLMGEDVIIIFVVVGIGMFDRYREHTQRDNIESD